MISIIGEDSFYQSPTSEQNKQSDKSNWNDKKPSLTNLNKVQEVYKKLGLNEEHYCT